MVEFDDGTYPSEQDNPNHSVELEFTSLVSYTPIAVAGEPTADVNPARRMIAAILDREKITDRIGQDL